MGGYIVTPNSDSVSSLENPTAPRIIVPGLLHGPQGPAGPIGPAGPAGPTGAAGPKGDPGDGSGIATDTAYEDLFVNDQSSIATYAAGIGAGAMRTAYDWAASRPWMFWTGDFDASAALASNYVARAAAVGKTAQLVLYGIPHRDGGGLSAGGFSTPVAYQTWIRAIAAGIGPAHAIIVVEPDALPQLWELADNTAIAERIDCLNYAINTIRGGNQNARIYIDAGNAGWHTIDDIVDRLLQVDMAKVDGISLNISNFFTDAENAAYGQQIIERLSEAGFPNKGFVIDSSRSGNPNSTVSTVFNPSNRRFGRDPKFGSTGIAGLHGWLWIKTAGESDGAAPYVAFNGSTQTAPAAGQMFPLYLWNPDVTATDTDSPNLGQASGMLQRTPATSLIPYNYDQIIKQELATKVGTNSPTFTGNPKLLNPATAAWWTLIGNTDGFNHAGLEMWDGALGNNKWQVSQNQAKQFAVSHYDGDWSTPLAIDVNDIITVSTKFITPALQVTGGTPGAGKVLTSDATGNATWQAAATGFTNPMTTAGDIIYGGTGGAATRLAKGTDGKVLSLVAGVPAWVTPAGGSATGAITGIIVAASDAPAAWTAAATYTCDGTADNVEIQSAITAAKADGRPIYLSPGTFNIAASIALAGTSVTDANNVISIYGSGNWQTNLVAGANINIMALSACVKVNIHNLMFNVRGTGSGITSTAANVDPYRAFWNSSFKNLLFRGLTDNSHTGWAMNLGSPFRSTFENIEAYNVGNGIKLTAENAAFNPGDCTFTRCFMELNTNATGIGYYLSGTAAVMNHCSFNICEAFTYATGAGTIGIKMDGAVGTMWNRFWGTNLEQFGTVVDIVSGEGNVIECNYVCGRDGVASTIFKTEAAAYNNTLQSSFAYIGFNSTIWNDANTTTAQPNAVINSKVYADTGATVTLTTVASSIVFGNVSDGAGTVPAAWALDTRTATMSNRTLTAPTINGTIGGTYTLGGTPTFPASVATLTGTQTLTNKTLTSPTMTTPALGVATATSVNKVAITAPATSATLTIANLGTLATAGAFSITLTATAATNVTLPTTGTLATLAGTETLTNKRIPLRTASVASAATLTPLADTYDQYNHTAQAAALSIVNPTGTPTQGQRFTIRLKDDGVAARALTWGTLYRAFGAALPTTTILGKTMYIGIVFNSADTKWDVVSVVTEV